MLLDNQLDVLTKEEIRQDLDFVLVDNMDQVLAVALESPLPQMAAEPESITSITPPAQTPGDIPTARQ